MEKLRKYFAGEVKAADKERTFRFIASDESIDRDGEVIKADGWDLKNYKKNPVVLLHHNTRDLPVGKAKVRKDGTALLADITFATAEENPQAELVKKLVEGGYLNTLSVQFLPSAWTDGDGKKTPRRTYTKQELLEISVVTVPANPGAVRRAIEKGVISEDQAEDLGIELPEGEDGDLTLADLAKQFSAELEAVREDLVEHIGDLEDRLEKMVEKILEEKTQFSKNQDPSPAQTAEAVSSYLKELLGDTSAEGGDDPKPHALDGIDWGAAFKAAVSEKGESAEG